MNQDEFRDGFHERLTEVRYAETDQMGYAHHSVAVTWFELGRVAWMRSVGFSYRTLEAQGCLMPVVRLNMRYHAPARFEDRLIIQTRLTRLGRAIVSFENRVLRLDGEGGAGRDLLVEGRVELACVGPSGQVRRMPGELMERFSQFLHAAEPGNEQTRPEDG